MAFDNEVSECLYILDDETSGTDDSLEEEIVKSADIRDEVISTFTSLRVPVQRSSVSGKSIANVDYGGNVRARRCPWT